MEYLNGVLPAAIHNTASIILGNTAIRPIVDFIYASPAFNAIMDFVRAVAAFLGPFEVAMLVRLLHCALSRLVGRCDVLFIFDSGSREELDRYTCKRTLLYKARMFLTSWLVRHVWHYTLYVDMAEIRHRAVPHTVRSVRSRSRGRGHSRYNEPAGFKLDELVNTDLFCGLANI
jgi:hypothetical protein